MQLVICTLLNDIKYTQTYQYYLSFTKNDKSNIYKNKNTPSKQNGMVFRPRLSEIKCHNLVLCKFRL